MRFLKGVAIVLLVIVLLLALGPFLIPISPLDSASESRDLADSDSQFIEINGLQVHYKRSGQGDPAIFLLHGFGASTFSWQQVMEPLSAYGTVIASIVLRLD
jgi:hypothetical protein